MTALAAVVLLIVVRDLLAGYGGAWFLPVLATEAMWAALPFATIAVAAWVVRRTGSMRTDRVALASRALEYGTLLACFGESWIAPHTSLARSLATGARLGVSLFGVGAAAGLLLGWFERRRTPLLHASIVVAVAGWLIVGPSLYADLDHLAGGRRLATALAIGTGFMSLGVALFAAFRLLGARRVSVALALAATAALALAASLPGPTPAGERASIVLVIVDTLRADMLDRTRPGDVPLMPRLRGIATGGVRFTTAIAPSPWTLPSTVSILSGLNPYRHGVGRIEGFLPLA
ncbi:MAG: sulfatase-like hydrolase/transferase, partial [Candidatus Binatia bacterium]